MKVPKIDKKRILELFEYKNDGHLYRKINKGRLKKGDKAGTNNGHGYIRIGIDKQLILEHRIVWYLFNGEWNSTDIDHINGIKSDNRIENLRLATRSENMANMKTLGRSKGVVFDKSINKWRASIMKNYKSKYLGIFDNKQDAIIAYNNAAKSIYQEFASINEGLL